MRSLFPMSALALSVAGALTLGAPAVMAADHDVMLGVSMQNDPAFSEGPAPSELTLDYSRIANLMEAGEPMSKNALDRMQRNFKNDAYSADAIERRKEAYAADGFNPTDKWYPSQSEMRVIAQYAQEYGRDDVTDTLVQVYNVDLSSGEDGSTVGGTSSASSSSVGGVSSSGGASQESSNTSANTDLSGSVGGSAGETGETRPSVNYPDPEQGSPQTSQEAGDSDASKGSAAERLASVTSEREGDSDYRDEYLGKINKLNVRGTERYDDAGLTVYSDDGYAYTMDDPIAGRQIQRQVESCLYHSAAPRDVAPRKTRTAQRLIIPGENHAKRFVRRTHEGEIITDLYRVERVVADWDQATEDRVLAYFFGYKVPEKDENRARKSVQGRLSRSNRQPPEPAWHQVSCHPTKVAVD